MNEQRRILLVDDNPQYRAAVTRNLTLEGYHVFEAEDSIEGMEEIQTSDPHIVITDLDMRTHDEGLQFIQEVKRRYPSLPIIMISAVGTFEEGAAAQQHGATFVLSKSRMDAEIQTLYERLDRIFALLHRINVLTTRVDDAMQNKGDLSSLRDELNILLQDQHLDAGLKSVVYDLLDRIERESIEKQTPSSQAASSDLIDGFDEEAITTSLRSADIPEIELLDPETRTMLCVAEYMFRSPSSSTLSVERNVSFSFSFAVENEVKLRVGRKINRVLSDKNVRKHVDQLYDTSLRNLDLFFNQYLIRMIQQYSLELNSDITRQVLERIRQHGSKYKPDGLKALGVLLYCWGQNHEFSNRNGKLSIKNPLHIKGLEGNQVSKLASQLIHLQHLRNPFIHPEFSEREKTESVRQTTLECLSLISHVV